VITPIAKHLLPRIDAAIHAAHLLKEFDAHGTVKDIPSNPQILLAFDTWALSQGYIEDPMYTGSEWEDL
jgi:hypothetical protein